ncbi:MAG: hypothetical protein ABJP45_13185 [Cyclobacteriaceae bacterium]
MKLALNEIWNFHKLIDDTEKGWSYGFHAGDVEVTGLTNKTLKSLQEDADYDTELLPSLFTFREILWQPDVFTEATMSLPSLRILKAFCDEASEAMGQEEREANKIYIPLIRGLGNCCGKATERLEKKKPDTKKVLGDFRTGAFPVIKFFIYHPKNRHDYYIDAVNRLNYAVKIMLTQFHGRYTELEDPYWSVAFDKKPAKKESVAAEQSDPK